MKFQNLDSLILTLGALIAFLTTIVTLWKKQKDADIQIAKERSVGATALANIARDLTEHHNKLLEEVRNRQSKDDDLTRRIEALERRYEELMQRIINWFSQKQ